MCLILFLFFPRASSIVSFGRQVLPSSLCSCHLRIATVTSVALHDAVDVLDEDEAGPEADEAKHDEEGVGNDGHVPEVEAPLQPAVHAGPLEEVKKEYA